ncbi:hypothetical protein B0H14DRAFT_2588490 [Mycena olivaceomarginata]|nr:hypothetical protein B0H14DRAFT_2650533 [Mycena olivaceomarginata]KAJ7838660.1 hypothetical protein B0H14DRAFT_2588490 [Mycena olivaceomarginata]
MAPDSKFTPPQLAHIASYYAEWDEVYANKQDKTGDTPARWKNKTADAILKSPLFFNQLPTVEEDSSRGTTLDKWKKRLVERFKNKKTQDNLKGSNSRPSPSNANAGGGSHATHSQSSEVSPLASARSFFMRPTLTGRRLVEIEEKEEIMKDANARAKAEKEKIMKDANARADLLEEIEEKEKIMQEARAKSMPRAIQFYKPAVKAAWNALSVEEQEEFNERALALRNDVGINQASFEAAIWTETEDFLKTGQFGDMTITILFGYRTPDDELRRGHVSSTSASVGKRFDDPGSVWDEVYQRWADFTEAALPPKTVKSSSEIDIPLDADGTPIFPEVDLDATPAATVALTIKEFVRRLWAHRRPCDSFTWDKAAAHYDKTRFTMPVAMDMVESVSGVRALMLAEFFKGLRDEERFVFDAEAPENDHGDGDEGNGEETPQDNGSGDKGGETLEEDDNGDKGGETLEEDDNGDKGGETPEDDGNGDKGVETPQDDGNGAQNEDDASGGRKSQKTKKKAGKQAKAKAKPKEKNVGAARPAPKRKHATNDKVEEPPSKKARVDAGGDPATGDGTAPRPRRHRRAVVKVPTAVAKPAQKAPKEKGMRGYAWVNEAQDGEA